MTRHPEPFLLWFYIEKYSKIKFFVFTFFLHSAARAAHRRPRCAFSPLSRPLPHPFLHSSHLDSILGVLFTASVFPKSRPPLLFLYFPSPAAPSITHSLLLTSPSACLPSLCLSLLCFSSGSPLIKPPCLLPPCPVHPHVSHLSSLAFCLLSLSFLLFAYFYHDLMHPSPVLVFDLLLLCRCVYFEVVSHIWTEMDSVLKLTLKCNRCL